VTQFWKWKKKIDNKINIESYWTPWKGVGIKTLQNGSDFDEVVLALSIGALPITCKELIDANPRWVDMINNLPAIQTQSFQIWMDKTLDELGWGAKLAYGDFGIGPNWIPPISNFADYSETIQNEGWEENTEKSQYIPKSVLYFCGTKEEPHSQLPLMQRYQYPPFENINYPNEQYLITSTIAQQSIRASLANTLLLKSGTKINPYEFDFTYLHTTYKDTDNSGAKFNQQFFRANIDPTERYVISKPDSTKYRLHSWESGFENLTLCGDWIYTGMNIGCAEGATMSGQLASYAIIGYPKPKNIFGYYFMHPDQEKITPTIESKF